MVGKWCTAKAFLFAKMFSYRAKMFSNFLAIDRGLEPGDFWVNGSGLGLSSCKMSQKWAQLGPKTRALEPSLEQFKWYKFGELIMSRARHQAQVVAEASPLPLSPQASSQLVNAWLDVVTWDQGCSLTLWRVWRLTLWTVNWHAKH